MDLVVQATFLRLVSVTEATVDALGTELTNRDLRSIDAVIRLLILEKELAAASNWPSRRKSFKRHHKVDLQKCAEHGRLEGAIEVRNAIAHGLGSLTTRQLHSVETPKALAKVNVTVADGFVDLRAVHVHDCHSYLSAFLRSLDSMVP